MLKRKLCEATMKWDFVCDGPLLIKDGRYSPPGNMEQGYPSSLFISHLSEEELNNRKRSCNNRPPDFPFYVPATSIRGPLRATAERIVRSLMPEQARPPYTACDPFEDDKDKMDTCGCSKRLQTNTSAKSPYAEACPACKIFGCAGLASRIQLADADITSYRSVYRDMIGIDRFTGGVAGGANMRFHALENTRFSTTVTITNFELWQLGLLAYVFTDFKQGRVPLGFGKSKGFGTVTGSVTEILLTYPSAPRGIEHLGTLIRRPDELDYYGLEQDIVSEFSQFEDAAEEDMPLYHRGKIMDMPLFWKTVKPALHKHIALLKTKVPEGEA